MGAMMRATIRRVLVTMAFLGLPSLAHAQAYSCAVPGVMPRPHPELPTDKEPARRLPIGGYTLAITWSPEYCYHNSRKPAARFECSTSKFGFTLHGLWPDGVGKDWPQYCQATGLLSQATINRNLCSTPSAQLLQHEWAKHGTCVGGTPDAYFARSTGLFAKLRYPDMDALSHGGLTVGKLKAAMATANPGMSVDAIRVTGEKGWLDEIWLCLDTRDRYVRCRAGSGGLDDDAALKIGRRKF
jgi:ribonuclease T2